MITIERAAWDDPRAVELRAVMDEDMHVRYGDPDDSPESIERAQVLSVDPATVVTVLLALDEQDVPLGHIAVRWLDGELELKRLIVLAAARGKGAATALLDECEVVGREVGAHRLVLQTGDKQPEAVALYEKTGWRRIPIYSADYARTMPFSICFDKALDEVVG